MKSYRDAFRASGAGALYDADQYRPGSYWDLQWRLEQNVLAGVVEELRGRNRLADYLDFACGTGRVLSYVQPNFSRTRGIDVSPAMLEQARAKCPNAELLLKDITAETGVEAEYDLITAFRFLLNAEDSLRETVLMRLAARLRDREARLIVNNHGSLPSYKVVSAPFGLVRRALGRRTERYLSARRTLDLLKGAGLIVERVVGLGVLPGLVARRLGEERTLEIERWAAGSVGLSRLGVNQIYVCRRA
ncbi:class I SAM-dependent DNA methyltransferase [Anaeromyxobacter paludicola]|uniref:class I SAM-dependent DNA methyltransferase n=1 Tax=Anaeromyxobacter paludicola TaxID=2918171 RepID=UPI0020BEB107|nr:class I SAM-dependent methyltransferase [Anaeromyxobacter paludicola]